MEGGNLDNLLQYSAIIISLIALSISILSYKLNYKKFQIDKSKLRAKIVNIRRDSLTARFPSIEDDNSKYIMELQIVNSGYKEELITQIVSHYKKANKSLEIQRKIGSKKRDTIRIKYKRVEIMELTSLEIIPVEDNKISIKDKEIRKFKREINKNILQLEKEWKDGVKK